MTRRRTILLAAASVLLLSAVMPAASATPPEDVLEHARKAVTIGQEKAMGMAAEAPGQVNRARGLQRAAQALADAALRKAERAENDSNGNGRALGKGHADEVHAYLLEGSSPSELPAHGETVRALAHAYQQVADAHPGRGLGLGRATENGD